MKHLFNLLRKLTAVAAVGIALTSCNRAEYAMLPKTGSSAYHGTQRATIIKPAPAAAAADVAVATEAAAPEAVVAPEVAAAPVATPAAKPAAVAKAAPAPAQAAPAAAAAPAKAPKMNFMQKALVQKISKKADKLAAKAGIVKKSSETASSNRLQGKLRQGVILLLAGLLIEILGAVTGLGIIYVLGAIVALIGLVLIILYLLDEV